MVLFFIFIFLYVEYVVRPVPGSPCTLVGSTQPAHRSGESAVCLTCSQLPDITARCSRRQKPGGQRALCWKGPCPGMMSCFWSSGGGATGGLISSERGGFRETLPLETLPSRHWTQDSHLSRAKPALRASVRTPGRRTTGEEKGSHNTHSSGSKCSRSAFGHIYNQKDLGRLIWSKQLPLRKVMPKTSNEQNSPGE